MRPRRPLQAVLGLLLVTGVAGCGAPELAGPLVAESESSFSFAAEGDVERTVRGRIALYDRFGEGQWVLRLIGGTSNAGGRLAFAFPGAELADGTHSLDPPAAAPGTGTAHVLLQESNGSPAFNGSSTSGILVIEREGYALQGTFEMRVTGHLLAPAGGEAAELLVQGTFRAVPVE